MHRFIRTSVPVGMLAMLACGGLGDAMSAHTDVVARAAGHELTVDEMVELLAPYPNYDADPEVPRIVAEFWVDYVLLATAMNEDTLLRQVDVTPVVMPQLEILAVSQLRDEVVQVDTMFTDDELRAEFEQSGEGVQVRARHILLPMDGTAPQPVRDSVRRLAGELRDRARGGEDFGALARQYSGDGSAQSGGDLGLFGRGEMLAPFEEAAFALDVGEVSDIVQTTYGLHVIKLEERIVPDFDSVRTSFRAQLIGDRMMSAAQEFVQSLVEPLNLEVQEGAVQTVRDIGQNPGVRLSNRAASRALVRYDGGALTAGEFQTFAQRVDASQADWNNTSDEEITMTLEGLTQNEVLVAEAASRGYAVTDEQSDSASTSIRRQLAGAIRALGLAPIQPQDGESMNQAVERRVSVFIDQILRGEQAPLGLGGISITLRNRYDGEVFEQAISLVGSRLAGMRAATIQPPTPPPAPPAPPDTGAAGGS